jgi:signal transduction histidine kinase
MRIFQSLHLLLLLYIVVALVFWGMSLQKQSKKIYEQDLAMLHIAGDSIAHPTEYRDSRIKIEHEMESRREQYLGEGTTFLAVILIGAFVVYKSFQRRIILSRQQNNFMLSVTHELKSPIAGIKLNLQTLERHQKLDESQKRTLLARSIAESDRLNDLCNNMLYASQLEGRQYKPVKEKFDLSELVAECLADYNSRYPNRFTEDLPSGMAIWGDKVMLRIALNNLLENAVKYTPPDETVAIRLAVVGRSAKIEVADLGIGIPDEEKPKVFSKFYRVGSEETRNSKGTGLGLYLAKKIVEQHKGKMTLHDNLPRGAVFCIQLPLAS